MQTHIKHESVIKKKISEPSFVIILYQVTCDPVDSEVFVVDIYSSKQQGQREVLVWFVLHSLNHKG